MTESNYRALDRWSRVHRAFFPVMQMIMVRVRDASAAVRRNENGEATTALQSATRMMRSSGAMFRFAGDFERTAYDECVRVTMSPPNQKEGFSGLWSLDHEGMLKPIKTLSALLREDGRTLTMELVEAFHEFLRVEAMVIEEHCRVCAIFGGSDGPSLQGKKAVAAPTALQTLKKIKTHRLPKPIDHERDAK